MKASARYAKIVEWSEEDPCYVGSSPGLLYGGCHGGDETAVFEELVQIVEETISLYEAESRLLPPREALIFSVHASLLFEPRTVGPHIG
ncbi:MAG: hypothetical protein QM766_17785 [Burkholderiaceae bacterium]